MYLTISHGAFDGMCSEFHHWRCAIARAAGYAVEKDSADEIIVLDWDRISDDNIAGLWPTPPTDPLLVLLVHSDMAGTIKPADAVRLADRLAELLVPAEWRVATDKFIAACRLAGGRNKPLCFSYDLGAAIARLVAEALCEKFAAVVGGQRVTVQMDDGSTVH